VSPGPSHDPVWPLAGACATLAAFLDPPGDEVRVGSGEAAELGGVPRSRLVQLTLARAQEDARYLGEQVRPATRDLAQLGDGGGRPVVGGSQRA
jgi:hypothetical protein